MRMLLTTRNAGNPQAENSYGDGMFLEEQAKVHFVFPGSVLERSSNCSCAKDHSAVAPAFLGLIQGFIGALDDALDVLVQWLVLHLGYSNAQCDGNREFVGPDAQGCDI